MIRRLHVFPDRSPNILRTAGVGVWRFVLVPHYKKHMANQMHCVHAQVQCIFLPTTRSTPNLSDVVSKIGVALLPSKHRIFFPPFFLPQGTCINRSAHFPCISLWPPRIYFFWGGVRFYLFLPHSHISCMNVSIDFVDSPPSCPVSKAASRTVNFFFVSPPF